MLSSVQRAILEYLHTVFEQMFNSPSQGSVQATDVSPRNIVSAGHKEINTALHLLYKQKLIEIPSIGWYRISPSGISALEAAHGAQKAVQQRRVSRFLHPLQVFFAGVITTLAAIVVTAALDVLRGQGAGAQPAPPPAAAATVVPAPAIAHETVATPAVAPLEGRGIYVRVIDWRNRAIAGARVRVSRRAFGRINAPGECPADIDEAATDEAGVATVHAPAADGEGYAICVAAQGYLGHVLHVRSDSPDAAADHFLFPLPRIQRE